MAKATKAKSPPLIDPEHYLDEEDLEFEDFLEELGPENPTVSIFRVLRDGTREQIDKVSLSEILNDVYGWLRENCGTGKYQLYFRGSDRRYRGAKTVAVGDRKSNAPAPAANGNSNNHQEWMEKQFTLQQNLVTGMLAALKGPDLGSLMQGIAQMTPKPQPQPDPAAMLTAVATVFATLRGPQKDEDWLTRAKTILELAKDMQPESGHDTVWSVVRDVGKEVVNRLAVSAPATTSTTTALIHPNTQERIMPAPAPAAHDNAIPPADAALAAQVVSPVVSPGDRVSPITLPQNGEDWLRMGLKYLKEKANLFKEPEIYVDQIFDDMEEPQWAALVTAVKNGATFETLLQFDSEIAQNPGQRSWFKRLYDGVHSELFPSMDSRRPGGNEDHARGHA